MKRIYTMLSLALAVSGMATAATHSLSITFDEEKIPAGIELKEYAEGTPDETYYYIKNDKFPHFGNGWAYQPVATDMGFEKAGVGACIALSRFKEKTAPDAWMILPELSVNEDTRLIWKARSVHAEARNSYDVMISEGGTSKGDFKLLTHVDKETYFFNTHFVSLKEYAGKNVRIAFVNNDPTGYMIAIEKIAAGTPEWGLKAIKTGHIYFGQNDPKNLEFALTNYGSKELKSLSIVENEKPENVLGTVEIAELPAPGETIDIVIPFEAEVGTALKYDLVANYADNSTETLLNDYLNVSYYRRRALIEKFSGTWCTSCPKVAYRAHVFEHMLGIDGIYAETHVSSNRDANACDDYYQLISYTKPIGGDYPALTVDRVGKVNTNKSNSNDILEAAIKEPCTADVKLEVKSYDGENFEVEATLVSAVDIDNTNDLYRVMFLLSEKNVPLTENDKEQGSLQGWTGTYYYGEVTFLPTKFPRDITTFHNITRSCSKNGGAGIANSLPATIKAGEPYKVSWSGILPITVKDPQNLHVVSSFIQYTENKGSSPVAVYNSCMAEMKSNQQTGVETIEIAYPAETAYYTLQGLRVSEPTTPGIYVKVEGGKATKFIVR
ncbi:MAG: choice-of-anchor J domain-containing protein [Clostridium sp.]|nr:choice-of-anchor J domain-containing protein [Prevotella sp.]MCM1428724.1 choice-of-anchor J domain-containing protein [Clostridium sp.]